MFICFAILLFLLSVTLVKLFQQAGVKNGWLDIPCARSSHEVPTVRGGGLVFMALWLGTVALAWQQQWISVSLWRLLFLLPLSMAIMGYWDDRHSLSARCRLAIQAMVALWVMAEMAYQGLIPIWPVWVGADIGATVVLGITVVWFINLFNFMDGLDGFAGAQAVVVLGFGGYMLFASGSVILAYLAWLLAVSVSGFLVWNWPKASIFMGDVGSMALGLVLVLFAYLGQATIPQSLVIWCILTALFWFDATLTLLRRYMHAEAWMRPHKQHAYQRLQQSGYRVSSIVLGSIALNSVLGTLALGVYYHYLSPLSGLFFTLGGLSLVYTWVESKKPMLFQETVSTTIQNAGRI
ncbi:MAG: hypothetical protein RLZ35_1113 [Pseudomonadota bacterium]|jgi:Fuc2NAc and GlcNAc transferase